MNNKIIYWLWNLTLLLGASLGFLLDYRPLFMAARALALITAGLGLFILNKEVAEGVAEELQKREWKRTTHVAVSFTMDICIAIFLFLGEAPITGALYLLYLFAYEKFFSEYIILYPPEEKSKEQTEE